MDGVEELPADLARVLFALGDRKLVLLEGVSDVAVFQEWYRNRRDVIEFFSPEVPQGVSGVQKLLARILDRSTSANPREYGIIDRDFRTDSEVEASYSDPASHLFILHRYCIENYLLEPAAVAEEVRVLSGENVDALDAQGMEAALLQTCRQLLAMMAANWLFVEENRGQHFPEAHDLVDRAAVVKRTARELGCTEAEADVAIAAKEAHIEPLLNRLETAHHRINGKHLLYHVHKVYTKTGINKNQFRNLLARAIRDDVGLPEDIKAIIEQRILA